MTEDCLLYVKAVRNTIDNTYVKLSESSGIASRTALRLPVNILGHNAADEILHKVLYRTVAELDSANTDFFSL